jgi:hypothetical protein
MAKKNKQAAPQPEEIPVSSAPLPLLQLDAKALGEFLELCFGDKRLRELCAELKLYSPGYRIEAMPPQDVARMLADEARAAKDAQELIENAVREALRDPVFEGVPVTFRHFDDMQETFFGDRLQHLARLTWRALIDEDPKVRELALAPIELGIELLSAPLPAAAKADDLPDNLKKAREEVKQLRKQAERADKERAAMKDQLTAARGDIAAREKSLAEVRDELTQARAELARSSADLARLNAAGEGRALADARRLADEVRSLSEKLRAAVEERDALRGKLQSAERRAQAPAPAPAPVPEEELPSDEEAATFLVPIFTREFYDSIQRWDRRMQRAAFDKVSLLARDWRHGSLRAIALEGLPGYYRIRVATDVRLIYRRGEGNTLEILSLIDREDLDRYIRQARTR